MRFVRQFSVTTAACVLAAAAVGCGDSSGPSGPPVVISVNGATLPSGPVASTVIIEGQNFGAARGSGAVLFTTGAGTVAATIVAADDWTDGFIVTTVPTGAVTGDLLVQTSEGTSTPVTFTVTQGAAFSPSTVSWTATSTLPTAISGLAAAAVVLPSASVVYATGGTNGADAPQATVSYTTAGGTGSLSGWTATTALPEAVAFHRALVVTPTNSQVTGTGFLFVLGGMTDTGTTAAIRRGTIQPDGSVSTWVSGGTLPAPLHSFGAAIVFGNLYVWGGAGSGNAPSAAAYRAEIQPTGALGPWQTLAPMAFGRAYFGFSGFGGHLYALGGDSSATAPGTAGLTGGGRLGSIAYARIDPRTGDIDAAGWVNNPGSLIKTTSKHTALVAGGSVLVTAGLYSGAATGSTEESYAQLNADGTVSSFSGATGSNTIQSGGGGNLFNHAVVGYVDGSGAFHVLVLGGDAVNNPGTKSDKVFFY